jgi:glutamyl-tRNA reductase
MTFFAFGLNHETAPVAVREAFALDEAAKRRLLRLVRLSPSAECVVLSTCNRTEVYLLGERADVGALQSALSLHAGTPWPDADAFALEDEDAVLHALRVAAGVTSQVLGDAQILAQVKDAYRVAVEEDRVGTALHRLMHTAFRTAKRVRTETAISEGAASISSLAVHAARRHFEARHAGPPAGSGGALAGRRVLLLGAGRMGLAALAVLAAEGASLAVANRSRERAEAAAARFGAVVSDWAARHAAAATADLVIVASGAPEPVLHAERLPARPDAAPTLVIDVAMPRNVEPAVAERPGYALLDLDRLGEWREETAAARRAALPSAEAICRDGLAEFVAWVFHHEALQPAIHALRETFEAIRLQEIERHAHRFHHADRDDLDRLTRSILQKLLAVPVVRLKETGPDSLDFARGVRFLRHAFSRPGCDEETAAERQAQADAGCPLGFDGETQDEEVAREDRDARE